MAIEYACSKLIKSTETCECPICLNECNDISITTCNHKICNQCITNWFRVNQTCPLCRTSQLIGFQHNDKIGVFLMDQYVGGESIRMRSIRMRLLRTNHIRIIDQLLRENN